MRDSLSIAMAAAVPLYIMRMLDNDGPGEEDFKKARLASRLLGEKGDLLLFGGGKKKGEVAHIFNETAKAIAVLSFCPGGINIFGQHFEAKNYETS